MATSTVDSLLQQVPLDELAERFGVDERTVESAVRQALPGLIGGMAVNASDRDGADRLERAVQQHAPADATSRPKLKAIDTGDGEKIVGHVLGDRQQDVAHALGKQSGDSGIASLIPALLPILAPIVMQFLAGKLGAQEPSESAPKSGGLGGVLGDLLGGLSGGGSAGSPGGGLGDVLGSVLGGGGSKGAGGLGELLGGLFGKQPR